MLYMVIWTPVVGEMLVVKIEPTNRHDIHAVSIYRDAEIVGHVPYNLAPNMSVFCMRENYLSIRRNQGAKVNRGAGYSTI